MKSTTSGIFYNYVLLDTTRPGVFDYGKGLVFAFEPFYVGKGHGKRSESHFRASSLTRNTPKINRIKKIKRLTGDWPKVVFKKSCLTEEAAFRCEIKLIAIIGRRETKQGPLVNLCDGGTGNSGRIDSPETIASRVITYKETVKNMPAVQRKAWLEKSRKSIKQVLEDTPKHVLQDRWARISAAHQSKTDEEHKAFIALCVSSNRSHEDATRAKMSRSGKARVAAMSGKERKTRATVLSAALTKMHSELTPEQRSARIVKGHLSRDKPAQAAKTSASVAAVHASRTDKQRQAIADKIAETLRNRSPADKQKQAAGNSMRATFKRHGIDINHKVLRAKCDALRDRTAWDGREVTRTRFLAHVERILYPHY